MTTIITKPFTALHKRLILFIVAWLSFVTNVLSSCMANDQLINFGFTPVAQTEIVNSTYCNRVWSGLSLCINGQEEFEKTMNQAFNVTNTRRMSLINSKRSNFAVLSQNLDQLFRNNPGGAYTNCSSLISPIDPNEFFTIFNKSYSNCFDNLNLLRLNWMCQLVTTNATNYLVNDILLVKPDMAYLYQMSCVPVLRVFCMYLKYFEYISNTRNEYELFSKAFSPTMLQSCNDTLVVCDNNYSNSKCLQTYKNLLVDNFFNLEGLKGEIEFMQLMSYYFENGTRPTYYDANTTEFKTFDVIVDSENGVSFSAVSLKGILSQYSSALHLASFFNSLAIILLLH